MRQRGKSRVDRGEKEGREGKKKAEGREKQGEVWRCVCKKFLWAPMELPLAADCYVDLNAALIEARRVTLSAHRCRRRTASCLAASSH